LTVVIVLPPLQQVRPKQAHSAGGEINRLSIAEKSAAFTLSIARELHATKQSLTNKTGYLSGIKPAVVDVAERLN
jgi:hypothetical protein